MPGTRFGAAPPGGAETSRASRFHKTERGRQNQPRLRPKLEADWSRTRTASKPKPEKNDEHGFVDAGGIFRAKAGGGSVVLAATIPAFAEQSAAKLVKLGAPPCRNPVISRSPRRSATARIETAVLTSASPPCIVSTTSTCIGLEVGFASTPRREPSETTLRLRRTSASTRGVA